MKHTRLFQEFIGEGFREDAAKELERANIGAIATGGGYGPFKKIGSNTWENKRTKRLMHSSALSDHIAGFNDFKIEESTELNEANSYYIETWYKDRNGNEVQLLGSDGTTVRPTRPTGRDIDLHHNRINSLRKIKPFLVGDVMYRVVGPDGKVQRTINAIIEEGLNEAKTGVEMESGGVKAERVSFSGIKGWKTYCGLYEGQANDCHSRLYRRRTF